MVGELVEKKRVGRRTVGELSEKKRVGRRAGREENGG